MGSVMSGEVNAQGSASIGPARKRAIRSTAIEASMTRIRLTRIANSGIVAFTSATTNSPPWPNTNGFNHVFVNVLNEELVVIFRSGFE